MRGRRFARRVRGQVGILKSVHRSVAPEPLFLLAPSGAGHALGGLVAATILARMETLCRGLSARSAAYALQAQPCEPFAGAGTELTSVRDNLCHASLYTTSIHLHGDEVKRATQIRAAFAERA